MKPYYEQDGVTIYHGDCREILPTLLEFDLCFTDAPYSIAHVDGGGFASARSFYREGRLDGLCDFDLSEYRNFLFTCAPQFVGFHSRDQILDYGKFCMECFGNYDLHFWHKTNAIPFTNNVWKSDVEYIALGWSKKNHAKVEQAIKSKVYSSPIVKDDLHPAQKPMGIVLKYLRVLQPTRIVDPFCGSGTTLEAAKAMGISAVGIEREEKILRDRREPPSARRFVRRE